MPLHYIVSIVDITGLKGRTKYISEPRAMVENGLEGTFTGPTKLHSFAGILLDMDGTIVDSTEAISKHWQK